MRDRLLQMARWAAFRTFVRPLPAPRGRSADGERVVLFKPDRIGDFVLATGVIRLLSDHLGPSRCTLCVSELNAELARVVFPHLRVVAVPAARIGGWGDVRSHRVTACRALAGEAGARVISLRHDRCLYDSAQIRWLGPTAVTALRALYPQEVLPEERLLAGLAVQWIAPPRVTPPGGAVVVEGMPGHQSQPGAWTPGGRSEASGACVEQERHRLLAESVLGRRVGLEEVTPRMDLGPSPGRKELLVAPFGSAPIRTYPAARLIDVLAQVTHRWDGEVRLTGGPDQSGALIELEREAIRRGVRRLAGLPSMSLADYARRVAGAAGVLTMESAPAHFACALDRPMVAIVGGGHYGIFAPWWRSEHQVWLTHRVPCFGCHWHCSQTAPFCVQDIPAAEVAEAVLGVLGCGFPPSRCERADGSRLLG